MAILSDFADLKKLLDLQQSAESNYPALTVIMDSVDVAIADYLGRYLEQDSYTETLRIGNTWTHNIALQGLPIASVTSVTLTQYGAVETLAVNDDFEIDDCGLYLLTALKHASITVVYMGGPEDVPTSWRRAGLMQAAYEWQNRDHIGADSVSTDGGFVSRPALQLLGEVRRLLDPDRHPWLRL